MKKFILFTALVALAVFAFLYFSGQLNNSANAGDGHDHSGHNHAHGHNHSHSNMENTLKLELKDGTVTIKLFEDVAPKHVARIKELASEGFYDGIVFHRVIEGFMAQTGDPTGTGMGGSKKGNLKAEFNDKPHYRGTLSMARSGHPDSANSQFFICLKDSRFLDKQYTVFGEVTDGMEFVDNIKLGSKSDNGKVDNPDKIVSLKVAK